MSRSLPLSDPTDGAAPQHTESGGLSGTVAVFDPAMCCPTGVCGPGVDPALLQIARDLRWLTSQGVTVTRVGLSQEPQAFVANARVSGLLQAFGDQALPAVLINDVVLSHGSYPSRDQLVAALTVRAPREDAALRGAASGRAGLQVIDTADDGCAPGSGCC